MLPTHLDSPSPPTIGPQPRPDGEDSPTPAPGQAATVRGPMQYRLGDGPTLTLPLGRVAIEQGPGDVTISWQIDHISQVTAMPSLDFARFVAEGVIVFDPQAETDTDTDAAMRTREHAAGANKDALDASTSQGGRPQGP